MLRHMCGLTHSDVERGVLAATVVPGMLASALGRVMARCVQQGSRMPCASPLGQACHVFAATRSAKPAPSLSKACSLALPLLPRSSRWPVPLQPALRAWPTASAWRRRG
eukprot:14528496-Alexandrium_andersonii.AAC.1